MADAVSEDIQAALNKMVTTVDQSANMRKDLKKIIFQTVSNLRNLFTELMGIIDEKTRLILHSETENNKMKVELAACRREVAKAHADIYRQERRTTRTQQQTGAAITRLCTKALLNSGEREHRKKAQIIAQVEIQPTPQYYREDTKVESEPNRHQGTDQITEAAQKRKSNDRSNL
jgi:regulator of replication initiation timing